MSALLGTCAWNPRPVGVRDLAMISVAYAGGLTGREIVLLEREDWSHDLASLDVQSVPGGAVREVLLGDAAASAAASWTAPRGKQRPTPKPRTF